METITRENLAENLKLLRGYDFPADLKELHEFILESSQNGKNWNADKEPDVRAVSDSYFKLLNSFLKSQDNDIEQQADRAQKNSKAPSGDKSEGNATHKKGEPETAKSKPGRKPGKKRELPPEPEDVIPALTERIPDEIRFIRRFVGLHGKKKTKHDLLLFINALHRSMLEKKIRKTSPYAKQILFIQERLVKTFNSMTKATIVPISEQMVAEFKEIIKSEKVFPSMMLIKRYINLNGKFGVKDKAKQLIAAMSRAYEKGLISKRDKYIQVFDQMHKSLNKYVKNKNQKILAIEEPELSGLNGLMGLSAPGLESLDGVEGAEDSGPVTGQGFEVMSLDDARNAKYETIGLTEPYLQLIGNACRPTHLFAYGEGGSGKSSFALQYAEFLNKLGYKVLYVAGEEFNTPTLKELVKRLNLQGNKDFVLASNLNVLNPKDFDFVAIDSKDSIGIEVEDFRQLKKVYPDQSWVITSQGTKAGDHTGSGQWRNEVDTMVFCENGIAKTGEDKNRWGGKGEMPIFLMSEPKAAA